MTAATKSSVERFLHRSMSKPAMFLRLKSQRDKVQQQSQFTSGHKWTVGEMGEEAKLKRTSLGCLD